MISKANELAYPSVAERCFFTLRSSLFTSYGMSRDESP